MKRVLKVLLLFNLFIFLSCGNGEEQLEESNGKVGLLISSLDNPFFIEMKEAAEIEAFKYNLEIIVLESKNSALEENVQAIALLEEEIDILLFNPTDSNASSEVVELMNNNNVPVITLDRTVESGHVETFIRSDNVAGGKLAAEYIHSLLGGTGNIFVVEGIIGASANTDRISGFLNEIQEYDYKIVGSESANFDRTEAKSLMKYKMNEDIDAIFAANDEMALGVSDALREVSRTIPIVGFDGTDEAIKAVVNGYISATISQQPDLISKYGIETAYNILNDEPVGKDIFVDLKLESLSK
jgi:ribose transport system substrate-binding protein